MTYDETVSLYVKKAAVILAGRVRQDVVAFYQQPDCKGVETTAYSEPSPVLIGRVQLPMHRKQAISTMPPMKHFQTS